ncbi:alpha-tubulin N-acetyltransferase 1-like [Branchiostoma floridae]|uniref:Alpha-tubulin N-acetyltransferase 1-like n=1 Tax=Branchiostoma floridae TaxID=7739 RepID=A0A9J7HTL3_BRAFL|nr:alpha-tubulin N-acetyltransferase 1-like [Branchiostoma floridae]
MEFSFNIHSLFGEEISLVDCNCAPFRKVSNEPLDKNLTKVIDDLGEASAKAQGLHGPITAAYKLRNSDHRMYILKDAQANSGKGAAVGFIKVGTKKLFVLVSKLCCNYQSVRASCVVTIRVGVQVVL